MTDFLSLSYLSPLEPEPSLEVVECPPGSLQTLRPGRLGCGLVRILSEVQIGSPVLGVEAPVTGAILTPVDVNVTDKRFRGEQSA